MNIDLCTIKSEPEIPAKKTYVAPTLTVHGDAVEKTRGVSFYSPELFWFTRLLEAQ